MNVTAKHMGGDHRQREQWKNSSFMEDEIRFRMMVAAAMGHYLSMDPW